MRRTLKLWTALGIAIAIPANAVATSVTANVSAAVWALTGEGGEGGEAGGLPGTYRLDPFAKGYFKHDAKPVVDGYIALVEKTYGEALTSAITLQRAIDALLAAPSAKSLERARRAWLAARPAYLQSEAFRYYEGPIDQPGTASQPAGPESRLNAWPLNEAVIDAVRGNEKSGLIQDFAVPISRETILKRDQASDEADVTTGYHAIEFLLWGQDFNASGPGQRPHTDFVLGTESNARRRAYLFELSRLLVDDLRFLHTSWQRDAADSYANRFAKLPQIEAVGRMLAGITMLAAEELTSERLTVALDSGSQEDEHSCFSDNTHNDFKYDLKGIRNVYLGEFGAWRGAGLSTLVRNYDPALDDEVRQLLANAAAKLQAIPVPFDQMLATPPGSPARAKAEAAVDALYALAAGFKRVGQTLGILVIAPGG